MGEFEIFYVLIALFIVSMFVVFLEHQSKKNGELVSYLIARFQEMNLAQGETNLRQIDSMIAMNGLQADRHQLAIDSLLGLIDEMSSRTTPDKLTAKQIANIEDYLTSQNSQK